ncbi:hypothetical protein H1C71_007755 [Ictidomys tridecemlineatus]|nr:hypothetical protein H1C71_007755 [Ictidomys tridecemlineatus]
MIRSRWAQSAHLQAQQPGRLTQEDHKLKASLSNIARSCLKMKRNKGRGAAQWNVGTGAWSTADMAYLKGAWSEGQTAYSLGTALGVRHMLQSLRLFRGPLDWSLQGQLQTLHWWLLYSASLLPECTYVVTVQ